jgi:hypothetical protein
MTMADFSVPALTDYGNLMNAFPQGQANIAATNAGAALTQAQAQGALIGNQQQQIQLQLLKQGLARLSNFSGQTPPPPSGDQSGVDPNDTSAFAGDAGLDVGLRQRFWVNPVGTPQEQSSIVAAHMSGNKGLADAMTAQRDQNVAQRTAIAQEQSSEMFDAMQSVQSAPPGLAMRTFEAVMPQGAKLVQQEIDEGVDPDEAARDTAAHVAASVHQYTGRPIEADTGGQYRDKATGQPIANTVAGMNAQQTAALRAEGMKLVDVPQSDGSTKQEPTYMAQHFPSLTAWTQTMASRLIASQSLPAAGSTSAAPGATPGVAPSAPAPGTQTPAGPLSAAGAPAGSPPLGAAPTAPTVSPAMKQALGDSSYRLANQPDLPKLQPGQTPSTEQKAAQADVGTTRSATFKDTQEMIASQQQALTFYRAAQQLLASPDSLKSGAYNGILAEAARWLKPDNVDTSNYQQVVKYLSNAAIQSAATTFPKMTDSAKKLALTTLNPNAAQTPTALQHLIATQMANSQYMIDTANRFKTYNMAGNDPRMFYDWNRQYFPQEKVVVPDSTPPKGKVNAAATTPAAPAAARPDATGFIQGRLYPGANGSKARYLGGGQWQVVQ